MKFFQNYMIMTVNLQILIQDVINETINLSQKVTFESTAQHSAINMFYFEKPGPSLCNKDVPYVLSGSGKDYEVTVEWKLTVHLNKKQQSDLLLWTNTQQAVVCYSYMF